MIFEVHPDPLALGSQESWDLWDSRVDQVVLQQYVAMGASTLDAHEFNHIDILAIWQILNHVFLFGQFSGYFDQLTKFTLL